MDSIITLLIFVGIPLALSSGFFYAVRKKIPNIISRPSLFVRMFLGLTAMLAMGMLAVDILFF